MVNIIEIKKAKNVSFDIDGKIMYSGDNAELIHLTLKPGEKLSLHKNPFDVLFYVKSGIGNLVVEKEIYTIEKDSALFVDASKMRAWENKQVDENLCILVFKML